MAWSAQTGGNAEGDRDLQKQLFDWAMKGEWGNVITMYANNSAAHDKVITKAKDTALHIAVSDGQEQVVEHLVHHIKKHEAVTALKIPNEEGNTPLHLAAAMGSEMMCHVIAQVDPALLEIRNNEGETPFFLAASSGQKRAFLRLHHSRKHKDNALRYPNCRRNDGETILHCAIDSEYLDLAYQIIHLYEELVSYNDKKGLSPLHYLAMKPTLFRSGSHIRILNTIIYHCTFVDELKIEEPVDVTKKPKQTPTAVDESEFPKTYQTCILFSRLLDKAIRGVISVVSRSKCSNPDDVEAPGTRAGESSNGNKSRLVPDNYIIVFSYAKLISKAMLIILGVGSGNIKRMQHKKEKHTWSLQILHKLMPQTSEYYNTGADPEEVGGVYDKEIEWDTKSFFFPTAADKKLPEKEERGQKTEAPILLAAKNGVTEMVKKILKDFPVAINETDEQKKNVVLLAAENRQPHVYKLLLDRRFLKDVAFRKVDKDGNSALHLAAKLVENDTPWVIPGAALQMQWEIKWYEYVRDSKPVHYFPRHNKQGQSQREIFIITHRKLLQSAGDWLTKTSESCSVVAALIATVAFATAATVPGGNDQGNGTPVLKNKPAFDVFAIGSLFALGFSITALVMFLAILTSRHQEKDFRTSLPWKLLLGLTSLFMSIATMLVSFCAGHFFVLTDNLKYAAFPIYAITCLPVTFFAAAQFPLYFDVMRATFMEVPLRSYTVVSDSVRRKTAECSCFQEDVTKEDVAKAKRLLQRLGINSQTRINLSIENEEKDEDRKKNGEGLKKGEGRDEGGESHGFPLSILFKVLQKNKM